MTTPGSALILLNQLLSLTTPTPTPLLFSPLSVSPSPSTAPPSATMPPITSTPFPAFTFTPFPAPILPSPSYFFSPEFETRYLFGIFLVLFVFLARTFLSIYRFVSRICLLKALRPNMTYFSSIHTVLRTGSFEGI